MNKIYSMLVLALIASVFAIEQDYVYTFPGTYDILEEEFGIEHTKIVFNSNKIGVVYNSFDLWVILLYGHESIDSLERIQSIWLEGYIDVELGDFGLYAITSPMDDSYIHAYAIEDTILDYPHESRVNRYPELSNLKSSRRISGRLDNRVLCSNDENNEYIFLYCNNESISYEERYHDTIPLIGAKSMEEKWILIHDDYSEVIFEICAYISTTGIIDLRVIDIVFNSIDYRTIYSLTSTELNIHQYQVLPDPHSPEFYIFRYPIKYSIPMEHDYTRLECLGDYILLMNDSICDVYTKPDSISGIEHVYSLSSLEGAEWMEFAYNRIYYLNKEKELGIIDFADTSFHLEYYKPEVYAADIIDLKSCGNRVIMQNTLENILSTDFTNPPEMTCDDYITVPSVNAFDIWEDNVIATSDSGLYYYSITDSGELVLNRRFDGEYEFVSFNHEGVFVSMINDSLLSFCEINELGLIEELSSIACDDNITCLSITDDALFTITNDSVLTSYDITDIESPELITEYTHNPMHKLMPISNYIFAIDTTNTDEFYGSSMLLNMSDDIAIVEYFDGISEIDIKDSLIVMVKPSNSDTDSAGECIILKFSDMSGFDTLEISELAFDIDNIALTEYGLAGEYILDLEIDTSLVRRTDTKLCFSYLDGLYLHSEPIALHSGWNAFSYPHNPGISNRLAFPDYDFSEIFQYNTEENTYDLSHSITAGAGYWVMCDSSMDSLYIQCGSPIDNCSIDLERGWNFIGSVNHAVDVSEMLDSLGLFTPMYSYNPITQNYEEATVIEPFKAYWIFTDRDMELELR